MIKGLSAKMILAVCIFATFAISSVASAASVNVLAIGASNTVGRGISTSEAWPAALERMLKAKGYDAHVTVRAANGLTSREIMSYANSIPSGTQVVIYELGVSNDRRRNVPLAESNANGAQIARLIRAQGAAAIRAPFGDLSKNGYEKQGDGIHFTPKAHAQIAAKLVPQVIAAARGH